MSCFSTRAASRVSHWSGQSFQYHESPKECRRMTPQDSDYWFRPAVTFQQENRQTFNVLLQCHDLIWAPADSFKLVFSLLVLRTKIFAYWAYALRGSPRSLLRLGFFLLCYPLLHISLVNLNGELWFAALVFHVGRSDLLNRESHEP